MNTTTLSKKNQIVVPKDVRASMNLKSGEEVALYPLDNDRAVLVRKSKDPVAVLQGLGKDIWKKLGGTEKYLSTERSTWQK